jgi:hypothetical protein
LNGDCPCGCHIVPDWIKNSAGETLPSLCMSCECDFEEFKKKVDKSIEEHMEQSTLEKFLK